MIGLVMAGGRGSRMGQGEKLLLKYKKPMVLHVLDALHGSGCFDAVHAAASPNSPRTREVLAENGCSIIDTPGRGYSEDLGRILDGMSGAVFVASGDMPLLDGFVVRELARLYDPDAAWTSVLASEPFYASSGLSSGSRAPLEGHVYTGISLVNASMVSWPGQVHERFYVYDDKRVFNVNTRSDYELLCAS